MDVEQKINELGQLCKGSVMIMVNDHRVNYQTVEEFFKEDFIDGADYDKDDLLKMIENDTIYNVHAYPDSMVGFYRHYASSLTVCLDKVISTIKQSRCL